jgi:hypothetical protein
MTLLFRKQHAQDRIEGLDSFDWGEEDYAVVDETQVVDERQIGRIYKEREVRAGGKLIEVGKVRITEAGGTRSRPLVSFPVDTISLRSPRDNRRRTTQIRSEYPGRALPYPHRLAPP